MTQRYDHWNGTAWESHTCEVAEPKPAKVSATEHKPRAYHVGHDGAEHGQGVDRDAPMQTSETIEQFCERSQAQDHGLKSPVGSARASTHSGSARGPGEIHKPRPSTRNIRRYEAHVSSLGRPVAKAIDISGRINRRTAPTLPPPAPTQEVADLVRVLRRQEHALELLEQNVRETRALIRAKGGVIP